MSADKASGVCLDAVLGRPGGCRGAGGKAASRWRGQMGEGANGEGQAGRGGWQLGRCWPWRDSEHLDCRELPWGSLGTRRDCPCARLGAVGQGFLARLELSPVTPAGSPSGPGQTWAVRSASTGCEVLKLIHPVLLPDMGFLYSFQGRY